MRSRAFTFFDQDKSNDICFTEFCLALTLLVEDCTSKKLDFVCRVLDADGDGRIGKNDMRIALATRLLLTNQREENVISKEERKELEVELKELYPADTEAAFSFLEFKSMLEKLPWTNRLIEVFQIIPSPLQECKIILNAFKETTLKEGDTCYVVNNEWYRSWKLFVSNATGNLDFQQYDESSLIQQFKVIVHKAGGLKDGDEKSTKGSIVVASEEVENELSVDSITRPGEINNSELSGPFQGSLKYGLMVSLRVIQ